MNFAETLKLAFSAIWAHKLRSALTLLGMVVGVTAVVVVVSLIQGFNVYFDEKIAGIGAKAYTLRRFSFDDFKDTDTIAAAQRRNKEFTMADYEFLKSRLTLTAQLGAAALSSRADIKRGSEVLEEVPVDGTTTNMADITKLEIEDGRYFTDAEDKAGTRVAFIGADVADKLFPGISPVGQEITIRGIPYRVIGVATAKGTIFGQPQDLYVRLPLQTYGNNFGGLTRHRAPYFTGTAKDESRFNDAAEEARAIFRSYRRVPFNEKDNFGLTTPDAIMGVRDRVLGPIAMAAIVVPSIALVVGGIVVMNIMLVSVTERTKEIGIRKALGARQSDILKQFVSESVTLGVLGGISGVLIAWGIGQVMSKVFFQTYLSPIAVIIAVGVTGGIGVLAGLYPAWKAARLDPIEALRAD
jgi:putative ABC transport system permease protein